MTIQHAVLALLIGLPAAGFSQATNDFVSLFNGKDLTHWTQLPDKPSAFAVVNGILETRPCNGSDLFSVETYADFVLRFEYLLSKVGNSGVLIRCDPKNAWGTGMEVQLLAPWTPYRDDLHCTASLYGLVAVTNRPDETTGVWHKMEILCDRKTIKVSVDGKLATVATNTDAVEGLKDKQLMGAIGFQSNHSKEGEFALFRNLEIRNLDADPEYVEAGLYDADARIRTRAQSAAVALGAPMVGRLATAMDKDNVAAQTGAKQALFDIVANATAPKTPSAERKTVVRALKACLKSKSSDVTAAYVKWLLAMAQSD
jgi:hypothetical protein